MRTWTIHPLRPRLLVLLALLAAGPALAAGGHHGVDDAALLERGECEQESWFSRAADGVRSLHAGLSCRVGPLELGAAGEVARAGGSSSTTWNLEAKWARELAEGLSVGIDLQPVWQAHQRPRFAGTRFALLATWTPTASVALHLNLGRDFLRAAADLPHHGVALDWTPVAHWTLSAERFVEQRAHFLRAGVRWAGTRGWTLDLSRAQRLSGPSASNWTAGVSFVFGGD